MLVLVRDGTIAAARDCLISASQLLLQGRVLVEMRERLVAALAELLVAVRVPGARLLDEAELFGRVDELAELVDARAVEDLEVGLAERGASLFFTTLTLHSLPTVSSPRLLAFLAADVEADGAVELERVAAGGGLQVTGDDADSLEHQRKELDRTSIDVELLVVEMNWFSTAETERLRARARARGTSTSTVITNSR